MFFFRNYEKYFLQALKVRRLIAQDFERVWGYGVHALVTPTTLTTAPLVLDYIRLDNREQCSVQDYCTQPANLAGESINIIYFKLQLITVLEFYWYQQYYKMFPLFISNTFFNSNFTCNFATVLLSQKPLICPHEAWPANSGPAVP